MPKELNIFTFGEFLGFKKVETLDLNGKATLKIDLQEKLSKKCFVDMILLLMLGFYFGALIQGMF